MKISTIKNTVLEAVRFCDAAAAVVTRAKKEQPVGNTSEWMEINYTKETAALRRASMDLTRALAKMRKDVG